MRIIVCIKQVPEVAEIKFNNETKTIVREGVPNVVNPYDRRALAEGLRLREQFGGEVAVMTMGPPQARDALVECLAAGADRAIHLADRSFAASDTLATARALAMAIGKEKYDIVFCGKYTVDGETGQVGPELAELLDLPQVTGVTSLQVSEDQKRVRVERETDDGFETIECDLPALLTAAERLIRPIKVKGAKLESTKPIEVVSAADLSPDESIFGRPGSPTWVKDIRLLARQREVEIIEGASADEKAEIFIKRLEARGALRGESRQGVAVALPDNSTETASEANIKPEVWAVAELTGGKLRRVSFEMLGKSVELARKINGRVAAVVIGADAGAHVNALAAHGADKVYFAEDEMFSRYTTAAYTALLVGAIRTYTPVVVLMASTSNGRDLAPRIAARLAVGLTADCIDLDIDERGDLAQHKPAFGGNIVAMIYSRTLPQMATVKPGMLRAPSPNPARTAAAIRLPSPNRLDLRARLIDARKEVSMEAVELEEARRVICIGTGIGGPENIPAIEALARALDARIGATRRVVDQGWLPRHYQIGLTGKVIAPDLYMAVGVRGSLNHTIGIQQSGTIAAINLDSAAEIFETADLGIVSDWSEIVPAITSRLARNNAD